MYVEGILIIKNIWINFSVKSLDYMFLKKFL